MKTVFLSFLSIIFLVIMHLGIRNFGGPLSTPANYPVWAGMTGLIYISLLYALNKASFVKPELLKYILAFICLSLFSVLFNPILDYHSFLYKALGLSGGAIFFLALHQFRLTAPERDKLLFVIFISGLIEACIGLIQYYGPSLRLPLITSSTPDSIYGSFQQRNLFGSFTATSIVISLFLLSRPLFKTSSIFFKTCLFIFISLLSFALLLSVSVIGLVGAGLGALLLFVSRIRIYKKIPGPALLWLIAVLIGAAVDYASEHVPSQKTPSIYQKIEGAKSGDARFLLYRTSYEMFRDRPFFGQGFGNFGSRYLYYQRKVLSGHPQYMAYYQPTYKTHPHNEILYRMSESGLSGALGMVVLLLAFGYIIFRLGRERGGVYIALLLPLCFHLLTEYPFYQSAAHFMLFLILSHMPSAHFSSNIPLRLNRPTKIVFTTAISAAFIFVAAFLFRTLSAHMDMVKYNDLMISRGEIKIELLRPAVDNGYLRQVATRLLMDARLRSGLSKDKTQWIGEFVEWSEKERKATPYSALYVREAAALFALGKKKEAFALIEEGLSLYPGKKDLIETKTSLMTEEMKSRLALVPFLGR